MYIYVHSGILYFSSVPYAHIVVFCGLSMSVLWSVTESISAMSTYMYNQVPSELKWLEYIVFHTSKL